MSVEVVIVLALIVLAGALFVTEKLPIDLVALIIMATLLLVGIITPEEGIAGFSNRATVTVGALFVLSAGLFKSGAANFAGLFLSRLGKRNFWFTLIAMMVSIGVVSAFLNNPAVVAIFIPIVLDISRDIKVSSSKLLMPMAYASVCGGGLTLIGSSTNILVSSIAEKHGEPPFGMFELTGFGLVLFGAGIAYMFLIGVRMVPDRGGERRKTLVRGHYLTEIVLEPKARFLGKRLYESPLVRDLDIESLEIFRSGERLAPPLFAVMLREGDLLRVRCDVEKIRKLQGLRGITLKSALAQQRPGKKQEENFLVEAVVAPDSMLVGKSLQEARFRSVFGATVHAIRHRGETMTDDIEATRLYPGDTLLIEADQGTVDHLRDHDAFVVVSEVDLPTFRKQKMLIALAIVVGVVVSSALGVSIVKCAVIGAVLVVLTGCLTVHEAYHAIDWKVVFLLAGVLTLATALEKTGIASFVANGLVSSVGAWGPTALLSAFYLLTILFTEIMSNKAAVALLAPIAVVTARSLAVSPRPFLMAVMFAASVSFLTPVGHQVNMMVYGPGRFRFTDFIRVGAPLSIMFWLLATLLIPRFWPF